MKRLLMLIAVSLVLTGCERTVHRLDQFIGIDTPDRADDASFFTVACCKDSVTHDYPDFVPESHASFCEQVKSLDRTNEGKIGNDTYLATSVDCGNQATRASHSYKIGDEYYVGKGY